MEILIYTIYKPNNHENTSCNPHQFFFIFNIFDLDILLMHPKPELRGPTIITATALVHFDRLPDLSFVTLLVCYHSTAPYQLRYDCDHWISRFCRKFTLSTYIFRFFRKLVAPRLVFSETIRVEREQIIRETWETLQLHANMPLLYRTHRNSLFTHCQTIAET